MPGLLSPLRTIRGQILLAFMFLMMVVGLVGLHASYRIARGGRLVTETYDGALMSISYARAAAADFALMQVMALRRAQEPDEVRQAGLEQQLEGLRRLLVEDLEIATERAQSDRARQSVQQALTAVEEWHRTRQQHPGMAGAEALAEYVRTADREMELLVNYTAGDGFSYRQRSRAAVAEDWWLNIGALATAVIFSGAVTWLLVRHIVGQVAVASGVARRIATGQLDGALPTGGQDELGDLLRSLAVMRDNLRSMVQREVTLRQSAQGRLLDAMESSNEGIVVVGRDGLVVLANDQAIALLGWRRGPAPCATAATPWADLAASLPSPDAQGEVAVAGDRWFNVSRSATREGGFVAVIGDVTATKRQSARLEALNVRLDTALANMSQGLCLFDAGGRLAVVNARYSEIFGLPPGSVRLGQTLLDMIALRVKHGHHPGATVESLVLEKMTAVQRRRPASFAMDLRDGRAISVLLRPAPNGGWAMTYEDVTDRRQAEEKVVFLARHDGLTRLPNRTLLAERLQHVLSDANRGGRAAVLFLDLDRFKAVNDTLGHAAGDYLLQLVAERLQGCVGPEDMVSRIGGDEFAIVQPGERSVEDTTALARRIIETTSEPYDVEGQRASVGVSVGIAFSPSDGRSPDILLRNADMALYRAKAEGRGTWRVYEPQMDAVTRARRRMGNALREALGNAEFELRYQAIYDLRNDRVRGFEALLRWENPEFGTVSPAEFIPIAEELGLMVPIGRWVLTQACRDARDWPADLTLSVNVSPAQLQEQDFLQTVAGALHATALSSSRLNLEVTETVLMTKSQANISTLSALRANGVQTSLDDFGMGYSSLSYLVNFPMDQIKIDRTFIENLADGGTRVIAQAIIRLAHKLSLRVVAEGVETLDQLHWLRNEGCDDVQGYFVSRPSAASDVSDLASLRVGVGEAPTVEA